jgi:hypothetical protein
MSTNSGSGYKARARRIPGVLSIDEGGTKVEEEEARKGRDVLGRGLEDTWVDRAPETPEERAPEMPGRRAPETPDKERASETPEDRTSETLERRASETPVELRAAELPMWEPGALADFKEGDISKGGTEDETE